MNNKMISFLILSFFCLTTVSFAQDLFIYKQWHLAPKVNTRDIQASKKLAQYKNQKNIFLALEKQVLSKKIKTILSEGCEGVIDESFPLAHYGWNYEDLVPYKSKPIFSDILALIPLKIKVKYQNKVNVHCSDSIDLMSKNNLAFSDLRAYWGYHSRLLQFKKKSPKKYKAYGKSLMEDAPNEFKKMLPENYAKKMASQSLEEFIKYIEKRNQIIIKEFKRAKKPVALVIGALHADALLDEIGKDYKVKVITPKGLPKNEANIIDILKSTLQNQRK